MRRFHSIPTPQPHVSALTSALQARRQRNGANAEALVERELIARGFRLVEKVEVPFRASADGKLSARRKVSGDFRGVQPGSGKSLLVEVKRHDERLAWGAFRPHQITALDDHRAAKGITEVAWVDRGIVHFIDWETLRNLGFGPGKSIHHNGARIALYTPTSRKKIQ